MRWGSHGWQPRHLLAEDIKGRLLGAAPCYVKTHSRGEYVFDHGWAEAFERRAGAILTPSSSGRTVHTGDRPRACWFGRGPWLQAFAGLSRTPFRKSRVRVIYPRPMLRS